MGMSVSVSNRGLSGPKRMCLGIDSQIAVDDPRLGGVEDRIPG